MSTQVVPGTCTSPWVFEGVVKYLCDSESSLKICFGDADAYGIQRARESAANWGLIEAASRYGATFVNLSEEPSQRVYLGKVLGTVDLPTILLDVDAIVSIPVVKTHYLTVMTGALKNQWGLLPDVRYRFHPVFAEAISEINMYFKEKLFVVGDLTIGGRTGGTGTGGPGVGPGGGGGNTLPRGGAVPLNNNPRFGRPSDLLLPRFPESASTNQQVLYMLAEGTGGFVIVNTNDLLGGLEKISRDQNEYYILGYTPPESEMGTCHNLKVKVNKGGTNVRARTYYCNVKSVDPLAGKPAEKQLETRAVGDEKGTISAVMQAPFFYTSADTARVNVAIEIPGADIKFDKVKGKLHAEMNVLGLIYRPNAEVAGRFSDTVKLDFEDKKEVEKFAEKPYHYENQFDVAAGKYTLKVAFSSSGESFGKLEAPLNIDAYDGKQFMLSGVAFSQNFHRVTDQEANLDTQMLEGRSLLIVQARPTPFQFPPSGSARFKSTDLVGIYLEVYDPLLLDEKPPSMVIALKVTDRQSGAQKVDSGAVPLEGFVRKGSPVVPVGLKLPLNTLTAGAYRLEMTAADSAGRQMSRTTDFDVQ